MHICMYIYVYMYVYIYIYIYIFIYIYIYIIKDLPLSSQVKIGPHPSWYDASAIVALDPWGAMVSTPLQQQLYKIGFQ